MTDAEWLAEQFEFEINCVCPSCGEGAAGHTITRGPEGPIPMCAPRESER